MLRKVIAGIPGIIGFAICAYGLLFSILFHFWLGIAVGLMIVFIGLITILIAIVIYGPKTLNSLISPSWLVVDLAVFLSIIVTLFVLSVVNVIPLSNNNLFFMVINGVAFTVIFCWKQYIGIAVAVSTIYMVHVLRRANDRKGNLIIKIQKEMVFAIFATMLSAAISFIFSMTKTGIGMPDVQISLFFIWFVPSLVSLLIIRAGAGLLDKVK